MGFFHVNFAFMKWYTPSPVEGERRTRQKFAWEKVTAIDKDGKSVQIWLEWYLITEEFVKYKKEVVEEWRPIERRAIIKKGA